MVPLIRVKSYFRQCLFHVCFHIHTCAGSRVKCTCCCRFIIPRVTRESLWPQGKRCHSRRDPQALNSAACSPGPPLSLAPRG